MSRILVDSPIGDKDAINKKYFEDNLPEGGGGSGDLFSWWEPLSYVLTNVELALNVARFSRMEIPMNMNCSGIGFFVRGVWQTFGLRCLIFEGDDLEENGNVEYSLIWDSGDYVTFQAYGRHKFSIDPTISLNKDKPYIIGFMPEMETGGTPPNAPALLGINGFNRNGINFTSDNRGSAKPEEFIMNYSNQSSSGDLISPNGVGSSIYYRIYK